MSEKIPKYYTDGAKALVKGDADQASNSRLIDGLCAEIAPLVAKLAQWERDNGTLACIVGDDERSVVCEIISDWALTHAMRRIDEDIKLLGA
jgi:hypothetical protein